MKRIKRKTKIIKRRRKKANFVSRFYFSIIGGVLFLAVLGFGLVYSSQFTIQDVKTSGLTTVSKEQLTETIKNKLTFSYNIFGKQITIENFLIPQSQKMNSILMDFPEIESIDIKKDFVNKSITFDVKEKQAMAIWQEAFSNKCYLVDKVGGFIRECNNDLPKELLVVREEKSICLKDQDFKKNIIIATQAIAKQTSKYNLLANSFSLLSKDKLSLNVNDSCQIFFDITNDLDWQMEKMGVVLKQAKYFNSLNTLKYIDLRFGNQAIIK